jgi:hypothetical protein
VRQPPAPLPATQTLDAISGDIARMVDHNAVEELWKRYYRGDQNIFTRQLYSERGQQTFDAIKERYASDASFRKTIDGYNEEFEKLLNEVSRKDNDGTLLRSYLTSDSGKVYTMLAHASGRFAGM